MHHAKRNGQNSTKNIRQLLLLHAREKNLLVLQSESARNNICEKNAIGGALFLSYL